MTYTLSLARHEHEVRAAQRLRHQVFVEELGTGPDIDGLDEHCDHLLAHETDTGALVGACRLMPPKGALAAGRYAAETDFDLSRHRPLHGDLVELSRACIHPDHRGGILVPLMTLGVARYVVQAGHEWVGGRCRVPLGDRGERVAAVWKMVAPRHLSPEEHRVSPRAPLRMTGVCPPLDPQLIPPLVSGALSLGAWVCGEPGYSPRIGTAALYVLMSMRQVDPAHLQNLPDFTSA
ncbi:GNAT family N-acetyltransferase [Streptomyces noursei]|uniref:GNAT family N-acetyltransferase n=1 Tax=Streptomyces noursei TaxID=1971 RepID=UPI00215583A2|nr:GNAT family N-acetyltransferase [Streptomyces noursei]